MRSALEDAARKLAGRFRGVFSEETVATCGRGFVRAARGAADGRAELHAGPHRAVRARAAARRSPRPKGLAPKPLPEVLFVCEHNAGRSQMAAALAHELSGGAVAVRSAGTQPGRADRPGRGRGDERDRRRCEAGVPQAADRRGRARRGCRRDDGLRGRVPGIRGQALRGLGRRATPRGSHSRSCAGSATTCTTTLPSCSKSSTSR